MGANVCAEFDTRYAEGSCRAFGEMREDQGIYTELV